MTNAVSSLTKKVILNSACKTFRLQRQKVLMMMPTIPDRGNITSHPTTMAPVVNLPSVISATTINILLSIFGTLGNLLVLLVIFLNVRLASVSNLLLGNLAAIDLLCTAYLVPGAVYKMFCVGMGFCHVPETFQVLQRAIVQFVVAAAVSSLFAIAVDRYIAISFPFKYATIVTKRRTMVYIFLSWILAAFVSFVFEYVKFFYIQSVYCILLILVTISLYIHIFVFALKKARQIAALQVSNIKRGTNFLRERKSAKTMVIILGVFIVAWVPAVVFYAVVKPADPRFPLIQNWMNTIYFANASLNPFIYCVRSRNFRKRAKKLVKSSMIRFNL